MCAMSPGDRTVPKQESHITIQPLSHPDIIKAIKTLKSLFTSAYGPYGQLKNISNGKGGHVTVTSSSHRILQTLTISKPVIKLVTTTIQAHLSRYSDGGLLCGLVALHLISKGIESGIHRRLITEVNELLLGVSIQYLSSSECNFDVDTSHIDDLLVLVHSVLEAKPGCLLVQKEISHLSRLVFQAIVSSPLSGGRSKPLQYVCVEGPAPSESHLVQGVLVPYHTSASLTALIQKHNFTVALVGTSLSGDSDDFIDGEYELSEDSSLLTKAALVKIREFVEQLVGLGVTVVLCQKVVHPAIKRTMKEQGLTVLERFGLQTIQALCDLAGGRLMTSWLIPPTADDLGHLTEVSIRTIQCKTYVCLQCSASPTSICTVVLCNRSEESLNETKHTCRVIEDVVQQTMVHSYALPGAGLWLKLLVQHLTKQVPQLKKAWSEDLGCSEYQVTAIMDMFVCSLTQIAKLTLNPWELDVAMEMVSIETEQEELEVEKTHTNTHAKTNIISTEGVKPKKTLKTKSSKDQKENYKALDCYQAYVNAFRTGVGIANLVLAIQNCVQDIN